MRGLPFISKAAVLLSNVTKLRIWPINSKYKIESECEYGSAGNKKK